MNCDIAARPLIKLAAQHFATATIKLSSPSSTLMVAPSDASMEYRRLTMIPSMSNWPINSQFYCLICSSAYSIAASSCRQVTRHAQPSKTRLMTSVPNRIILGGAAGSTDLLRAREDRSRGIHSQSLSPLTSDGQAWSQSLIPENPLLVRDHITDLDFVRPNAYLPRAALLQLSPASPR
jgi:hypothetical protein